MARERANLPLFQDAAIQRKKMQTYMKERDGINAEKMELLTMRKQLEEEYNPHFTLRAKQKYQNENTAEVDNKIHEYQEKWDMYDQLIIAKKNELNRLRWDYNNQINPTEQKEERKKFIRRCTRDNCQGFLSTAWKCGMCEYYSCSKCFLVKTTNQDEPHECKPEDVETANMIKQDSKPCPKCGEFIMKTGGCSQMFCISCKTPWDWNTGLVVTSGPLHNPHYYEWIKRTGGVMPRNPADVPCGGFPGVWELRPFPRGTRQNITHSYYEFHRICQEIQDMSQRNYRTHIDQNQLNDYHVQYLLNEITEKQWGRLLAMNEKKRKRDAEIQEVFMAFRTVAVEFILRVQHYSDEKVDSISRLTPLKAEQFILELTIQINELIKMINSAFEKISISYHYSVPLIGTAFSEEDKADIYYLKTHNYSEKKKVTTRELIEEYKEMMYE
jgi:hypothetical protein